MTEKRKSRAKALGVKSAFLKDDDVIMTSFGRGNDAVVEKIIKNNEVQNINIDKPVYDVVGVEKETGIINVVGTKRGINTINKKKQYANTQVSQKRMGMDLIQRKDKLEKVFFNENFNDNIHIQLIYNILDIEKILSVYVNNIVYALGNLERDNSDDEKDLIGYASTLNSYEDFINKNLVKQNENIDKFIENGNRLGYFGNVFYKNKNELKDKKDIFDMLCLLGSLRQFCFHFKGAKFEGVEQISNSWLYNLSQLHNEFKSTLDSFYNEKIEDINGNFIEKNKVNIQILCNDLKLDKNKLVQDYYNFLISKNHKNMGFSIKKIREYILDIDYASYIKEQGYDSVRSKLFTLIDFIIYDLYVNKEKDRIDDIVSKLRGAIYDYKKDDIYKAEADWVWKKLNRQIKALTKLLSNRRIFSQDNDITNWNGVEFEKIGEQKLEDNADYFCKLMYFVTLFLDGKEINDLLTTLINKFDNIRSFIEVMEEMSLKCEFMEEYKFFNESKDICLRLKEIHSFARMKRPLDNKNVEKEMYKDAISILMKDSSIENSNIDVIFNTYIYQKDNKNAKKDFRNFIIKNVIKSNRFIYLIKYSNPTNVRKFASNTNVIKFVLGTLPDKQLERYYKSCGLSDGIGKTEWVRELSEIITGIDYSDFLNVKQRAKSKEEKEDKAKKQAIVTLYLTILYILTKNLVNVNSRYVIAVHCIERDSELYKTELYEKLKPEQPEKLYKIKPDKPLQPAQYFLFTKYLLQNDFFGEYTSKKNQYIQKNMKIYSKINKNFNVFVRYRNNIAHLNSIKNATKYVNDIGTFTSYFQLYHYIMQCDLKDWVKKEVEEKKISDKYYNYLEKYYKNNNIYLKDFVKAINVPFAYNYSRFKNLSIDKLFDKNDPRKKKWIVIFNF